MIEIVELPSDSRSRDPAAHYEIHVDGERVLGPSSPSVILCYLRRLAAEPATVVYRTRLTGSAAEE